MPLALCASPTITLASSQQSTPAPSHTAQIPIQTQNHDASVQHTPLHGSSHKNAHSQEHNVTKSGKPHHGGGSPDVAPSGTPTSLTNLGYRKSNYSHVMHVDPYSGRAIITIPLVNKPLNDGLSLHLTLSNAVIPETCVWYQSEDIPYNCYPITYRTSTNMTLVPGMYPREEMIGTYPSGVFLDPQGKTHKMVEQGDYGIFLSTDGYQGTFNDITALTSGTIIAPDGTVYHLSPVGSSPISDKALVGAVSRIESPHGGSSITYHYDHARLIQISTSDGYNINFSYSGPIDTPVSIQTSDGRSFRLHHGGGQEYDRWMSIDNIQLPDDRSWHFSWNDGTFQTPTITKANHFLAQTLSAPTRLHFDVSYIEGPDSAHGILSFRVKTLTISAPDIPTYTEIFKYQHIDNDSGLITTISKPKQTIVDQFDDEHDQSHPSWMDGALESETIIGAGKTLEHTTNAWTRFGSGDGMAKLISTHVSRGKHTWNTDYSAYNSTGFPEQIIKTDGNGHQITQRISYYQRPGHWMSALSEIKTFASNSTTVLNDENWQYNPQGQMLLHSINGVTTRYTYDAQGNIASITDVLGHSTHLSNYVAGIAQKITDAKGNTTTKQVNNNGTLKNVTDPLGNTTSYTYDHMLRPISISPPTGNKTSIRYNTQGQNNIILTRGNLETQLLFNANNAPIQSIQTDLKTGKRISQVSRYNSLGERIYQSYPSSLWGVGYSYDPLHRVITQTKMAHGG